MYIQLNISIGIRSIKYENKLKIENRKINLIYNIKKCNV